MRLFIFARRNYSFHRALHLINTYILCTAIIRPLPLSSSQGQVPPLTLQQGSRVHICIPTLSIPQAPPRAQMFSNNTSSPLTPTFIPQWLQSCHTPSSSTDSIQSSLATIQLKSAILLQIIATLDIPLSLSTNRYRFLPRAIST